MHLIGDPHLGREFRANVPLDRRGDRESMMMAEFEKQLNAKNEDTIIVGDLFEHPIVSFQTLYDTLNVILSSAVSQPNRKIIILCGNHDLHKETERKAYVHVMAMVFERVPNVYLLFEPTIIDNRVYFPWQYEVTALEQVKKFDALPYYAVGHWDLESFGGSDDHLCPAKELQARGVNRIYSGHWHVPGVYSIDGIDVICTGSMQPMTHAEDPKGNLYVTLTRQEYEAADPGTFRNKYVRVYLEEGEEITAPPTCLGFKTEITKQEKEVERVNLGTFDMNDILNQTFESLEVKKPVRSFIKENLNDIA